MRRRSVLPAVAAVLALMLAACGTAPAPGPAASAALRSEAGARGVDIALFALGLVDTGYRFGGKNPDAGFDCSGMVSYVYAQAAGLALAGSAADMVRKGRAIGQADLRVGDLVFFNTNGRPASHVGIYVGDGRFVHAPNHGGRVRTERLDDRWYASRYEGARSYFD